VNLKITPEDKLLPAPGTSLHFCNHQSLDMHLQGSPIVAQI